MRRNLNHEFLHFSMTTVETRVKHRCIGNAIHKPMLPSIGKYRTNTYNTNQKYEKTGW